MNATFSPGIQAMIPLLYVAWSDRVLTVPEIRTLRKQAADLPFLTATDREVLLGWSDPARPPGRDLFKLWEIETRQIAAELTDQGLQPQLVDLSLHLAAQAAQQASDPTAATPWLDNDDYRTGIAQLVAGLGPLQSATHTLLFPDAPPQVADETETAAVPFAVADLQAWLDGDYADTKNQLRSILTEPVFERHTLRVKEEYRQRVLHWCQQLADRGLGAVSYPAAYGGEGDMGKYGAVFEMIALHDLSLTIKFGVQFGLWGGAVYNLGTQRHHDTYLRPIGTLALPGCFAMTETGHGSNVRGLETTAVYDPETDEFIVHTPHTEAGKEYIGNALHGRMGAVFAQLIVQGENHGVHALVVPLRDEEGYLLPGVRIVDNGYKLGLNGVDNGRIWFHQVRVPRANLLDRFGTVDEAGQYHSSIENPSRRFFTMLGTLVGGRVCVPRAALSAAKSALNIAINFALQRRQFGATAIDQEMLIMDYPSHQRRLLPLLAKAYVLQVALDHLLAQYEVALHQPNEDMREIETLAAGMKSYVTWYATHCIQECREACGGKGYLAENRFADLKADTDIFTTFEGDNTVLMQLVAKGVLSDFRKQFFEEGNTAVLRYISRRIGSVFSEQSPLTVRNSSREHLTSEEFIQNAFQFRQRRLTYSLAQRLRKLIKEGKSAHEASLLGQTHMLALAEAYIEATVVDQYQQKVQATPQGPLRATLERLGQLYALHTLEHHRGWYLEQDYISGNKSKAIRTAVDELCAEVRPEARALVAAFGIPAELLGAPIAK